MTTSERAKLEKQLAEKKYEQSKYDSNKYKKGSDTFTFKSSNRVNNNGDNLTGYSNTKDRIGKK